MNKHSRWEEIHNYIFCLQSFTMSQIVSIFFLIYHQIMKHHEFYSHLKKPTTVNEKIITKLSQFKGKLAQNV